MRVFEAKVKNGVAYKKTCVAMTELIKSISTSMELHISISNTKLKSAKKQAKSKEHPSAELLHFEICSLPSSMLSSKNIRAYSEKMSKKPRVPVLMKFYDKKINKKNVYNTNCSYFL